jgi:hypothetical protein
LSRLEDAGGGEAPEAQIGASLETLLPGLIVPLVGALLGLGALKIAAGGVGSRPVLAVAVLVLGVAAAVAPFRYGLPVAVVLAGFTGFLLDFVGDGASYWNEVFAAIILVRSLASCKPSQLELGVAGAVGIVFLGYLATGTSLKADLWGLKVLFLSAIVGWAIARLHPDGRTWLGIYYGLAVVAVASLVLELWQRSKGVSGLAGLGLVYGSRIREITSGGELRAFGGFTSAAPLSYALAITIAAWTGFALGPREERRVALLTFWVPPIAAAGLYLTIDRTAILALVVAFAVLGVTYRPRVLVPVAAAFAAAVVAAASFGFAAPFRHQLGSAAKARSTLWRDYLADFRPLGRGPATAGSAYKKVAPKPAWVPPLRIPAEWDVTYSRILLHGQQYPIAGTYLRRLPPLSVSADAQSLGVPSRLTVTSPTGRTLLDRQPSIRQAEPIAVRLPPSRERTLGLTVAVSSAEPVVARKRGPRVPSVPAGELVNLVSNPSFEASLGGWYAYQGPRGITGTSIARTSRDARFGNASLEVAHAVGLPAGAQGVTYAVFPVRNAREYTVSAYLRGSRGGESVLFYIQDSRLPRTIQTEPFTISRSWRRYRFTWMAWMTDPDMAVWIRSANAEGPQTFSVDGVQIEEANRPTPYCDGSEPHCRWFGEPNDSPSYRASSTRLVAGLGAVRAGSVEEIHVASTWLPMPQKPPFTITVDSEEMRVLEIDGLTAYRVRRAVNGALPAGHAPAAVVWDGAAAGARRAFRLPPATPGSTAYAEPIVQLRDLRIGGVPPARSSAERIWQRWFGQTPAALQSDGPGLVDNLYVSWIWQYGLLGFIACLAWLSLLLRPVLTAKRTPASVTAALVGAFLIAGGVAVNIWEEAPTDFLAALVLAIGLAAARPRPAPPAPRSR